MLDLDFKKKVNIANPNTKPIQFAFSAVEKIRKGLDNYATQKHMEEDLLALEPEMEAGIRDWADNTKKAENYPKLTAPHVWGSQNLCKSVSICGCGFAAPGILWAVPSAFRGPSVAHANFS
jgi:hypothetical protein